MEIFNINKQMNLLFQVYICTVIHHKSTLEKSSTEYIKSGN